jgi:hypothetical protein
MSDYQTHGHLDSQRLLNDIISNEQKSQSNYDFLCIYELLCSKGIFASGEHRNRLENIWTGEHRGNRGMIPLGDVSPHVWDSQTTTLLRTLENLSI